MGCMGSEQDITDCYAEPTMPESILRVETKYPIRILTLANPRHRNPLSSELMSAITGAMRDIGNDEAVRAVILAAEGPVFSAGHDLREMQGGDLNRYRRLFDGCTEMMSAIQSIPQPVIAEVDGVATAAGCQLVATCDLALASPESKFATPGIKIGLFCSTPMVALTRNIGRKRALQMLMTGEMIDANQAADWGLVNRVVPGHRLREETLKLAGDIASASSLVVGLGKQAFYSQIDMDQAKAYGYVKEVMTMNALAADAQEGMCAFLEKRKPVWTDQ